MQKRHSPGEWTIPLPLDKVLDTSERLTSVADSEGEGVLPYKEVGGPSKTAFAQPQPAHRTSPSEKPSKVASLGKEPSV